MVIEAAYCEVKCTIILRKRINYYMKTHLRNEHTTAYNCSFPLRPQTRWFIQLSPANQIDVVCIGILLAAHLSVRNDLNRLQKLAFTSWLGLVRKSQWGKRRILTNQNEGLIYFK